MSFEMEDDNGTIEIDFNNRSIKGRCKAGKWKEHFKKVSDSLKCPN